MPLLVLTLPGQLSSPYLNDIEPLARVVVPLLTRVASATTTRARVRRYTSEAG